MFETSEKASDDQSKEEARNQREANLFAKWGHNIIELKQNKLLYLVIKQTYYRNNRGLNILYSVKGFSPLKKKVKIH